MPSVLHRRCPDERGLFGSSLHTVWLRTSDSSPLLGSPFSLFTQGHQPIQPCSLEENVFAEDSKLVRATGSHCTTPEPILHPSSYLKPCLSFSMCHILLPLPCSTPTQQSSLQAWERVQSNPSGGQWAGPREAPGDCGGGRPQARC